MSTYTNVYLQLYEYVVHMYHIRDIYSYKSIYTRVYLQLYE